MVSAQLKVSRIFLGGGGGVGGGINNTLKGIAVECIKSSLLEVGLQLTLIFQDKPWNIA